LKAELEKRLGYHLLYAEGCGLLTGEDANALKSIEAGVPLSKTHRMPLRDYTRMIAEAVEIAKKADISIVALGEPAWMEGEASSRAYLGFTGSQEKLLEAVAATGKP